MAFASYRARKRGSREQRACFRLEVLNYRKKHSLRDTAKHFGVSKSFICKWQSRYRERNTDIYDHSRNPKNSQYAYSRRDCLALQRSLIVDNYPGRKRNILAPTIYREHVITWNRSYSSIQRIARKLLKPYKSRRVPAKHKKNRTGAVNTTVCKPGEIVQIDMKCVPSECIVQRIPDDTTRKRKMICDVRQQHMKNLAVLDKQKALFPNIHAIDVIRRETVAECERLEHEIWEMDLPPAKALKLYQYTAVDVKSRWSFRWLFTEHSEAASFRFIVELLRRTPFRIQQIQTDNGSEFASEYLSGHALHITAFQQYLDDCHIAHLRIHKGKPWENGHVEAQHRIDQERFYTNLRIGSLSAGIHAMIAYQRTINAYPKRCLEMKSPLDTLRAMA